MSSLDDVDPPLSPAEARYLRGVLGRLRSLESRTRGSFAEALVCELLPGATEALHAVSPHDVEWKGIKLAVRTTGSRNADHVPDQRPFAGSWNFRPTGGWADGAWLEGRRRCWADVALLAFHDGFELGAGWRFYVLTADQVERFPAMSISPSGLAAHGIHAVDGDGLAEAVRTAASETPAP